MIKKMGEEIKLRANYLSEKQLKTVYFGGGTPSLLNQDELQYFFKTIQAKFSVSSAAEITLEANPDDITIDSLQGWKKAGINRLSIGLQSFRSKDLEWMNRAHSVEEALNCVKMAKEQGFDNISVDLIYGLPELSAQEWEQHIDAVLRMNVQHVSAYCLTVEEKTALHHFVQTKKIIPGGEEEQSEQFLTLSAKLKAAGFRHYEISNFGMPGFEAQHNTNYWRGKAYLGIGPSAHSFDGTSRRWNIANNARYIKEFATESMFEEEQLGFKERWNELILTGLRTSFGVDLSSLASIRAFDESFYRLTHQFIENKWMIEKNNTILLTDQGRLMADHIASELFL